MRKLPKPNPFVTAFPLAKRSRQPRLTKSLLKYLKSVVRHQPKGMRLPEKLHVQWLDRNRRFSGWSTHKKLEGVISLKGAKRSASQKAKAKRARIQDVRRRLTARMDLLYRDFMSLASLAKRYPRRKKVYRKRFLSGWTFTKTYTRRRKVRVAVRVRGKRARHKTVIRRTRYKRTFTVGPLDERLGLLRQEAFGVRGAVLERFAGLEEDFRIVRLLLGIKVGKESQWQSVDSAMNAVLAKFGLDVSAFRWEEGQNRSPASHRGQPTGLRPSLHVWVNQGDYYSHPKESANMLMVEEMVPQEEFPRWYARLWWIFAVCKMPPIWDSCITDGRLERSPERDKRKSALAHKLRGDAGRKKGLSKAINGARKALKLPPLTPEEIRVVVANRIKSAARDGREITEDVAAHDVIEALYRMKHGTVYGASPDSFGVSALQYVQSEPGSKYVILGCPAVYRPEMIKGTPKYARTRAGVQVDSDKNYVTMHDWLFLHAPGKPTATEPFNGQAYWKKIYQAFYWHYRKKFVYPIMFLGYAPRIHYMR